MNTITHTINKGRRDSADGREARTCDGCAEASEVTYARQLLAKSHPEWTLQRLHDRALILAIKMRNCDLVRITHGG